MTTSQSDASRFLMQASLGATPQSIDQVAKIGIPQWLDQQLNHTVKRDTYERKTSQIWQHFRQRMKRAHGAHNINGDGNNPALPYKWYFKMAWWDETLSPDNQDHWLRQRVAQALSEILVISDNSSLELDAEGMASFYDILYRNAFGSYASLLEEVSLHPCMGIYLSHMNNQKANPAKHIHPDENYAREIMQLFTIGLYELNADGSRKQDAAGNDIPSYDNDDIKQMARVFTGLKAHSYEYEWTTSFWTNDFNGYKVDFDDGIDKTYKTIPFINMLKPMTIDERYHDRGAKQLLNNHISLPAGQSGKSEIPQLVQQLVAHHNTAPFVATHLIKQMVTSNPSPAYVKAVADKFGKEGNLADAIRELLTYPQLHPVTANKGLQGKGQKLKSPLLRTTQLLRAFGAYNKSGKLWLLGETMEQELAQHPLSSPTVFNFYKPDYTPHGPIEEANLVAPEFELHTPATSIAYVNLMYHWFFAETYPSVSTIISQDPNIPMLAETNTETLAARKQDRLRLNLDKYVSMAQQPTLHDKLIEDISLLLTGVKRRPNHKHIKRSFATYADQPLWVVQTVIFMTAIAAGFTVQEA